MASDLIWQSSSAPTSGAIGDVNTMLVDPHFLGMAQDVIIDTNGTLRSRGAITSVGTVADLANIKVLGVGQTSAGTVVIGNDNAGDTFLYGTNTINLTGISKLTSGQYNNVVANSLTLTGSIGLWSGAKVPNERGIVFCSQQFQPTGTWPSAVILWGGNGTQTTDTPAGTAASTIGTKAIVGVGTAWTSALVNTFLFINGGYVGQVENVSSTTALTLYKGALSTIAANTPSFRAGRTLQSLVYKGRITTNTASAIVVGSNTKFLTSGPSGSGAAHITSGSLFRYSDGAFIGTVTSVQNDTTLTLTGNAALALVNEEYYISKSAIAAVTLNVTRAFFGSCVEFWADRFWYGGINAVDSGGLGIGNLFGPYQLNSPNGIAFTKKNDPECLDLDPSAGDIINIPSRHTNDAVRALCATRSGLVVFRNNDTFIITGYSPETFRATKILDDGALNHLAFRPYKEGVVWAGSQGIWYFDGSTVVSLLKGRMNNFYKRTILTDVSRPTGLGITNDHVIVSYNTANITWPYKATTKTATNVNMVINMNNGAVSFFTNITVVTSFMANGVTGSAVAPILVVRDKALGSVAASSFLVNGDKLIQDSATAANNFDAFTTSATFSSGVQIGPDVMFETTKLTMGDASRLKFWKRFLMNYSSDVGMTASFVGINDTTQDFPPIAAGTASADVVAVSSNTGILHRMRFLVRSATCSIRVYQTSTTSATSQRFKCFWWSVGGKRMRQGRPQP